MQTCRQHGKITWARRAESTRHLVYLAFQRRTPRIRVRFVAFFLQQWRVAEKSGYHLAVTFFRLQSSSNRGVSKIRRDEPFRFLSEAPLAVQSTRRTCGVSSVGVNFFQEIQFPPYDEKQQVQPGACIWSGWTACNGLISLVLV